MPQSPDQLKGEYDELQAQTDEFNLAFQEALKSGDLEHAKGLKAQLEQRKAELDKKLLPFDPERDIAEREWQFMRDILDGERMHIDSLLPRHAMAMKILDPNIDLDLNETDWQKMRNKLEEYKTANNWGALSSLAMSMKILDPQIDLGLHDATWQNMRDELYRYRENNNWDEFSSLAMKIKILDPEKFVLNDEDWKGMRDLLDRYRIMGNDPGGGWTSFSTLAMEMKILDPDIDLGLDDNAWQGMRKELKEHNWVTFSELPMPMKILAAKHVQVTDEGLEVKMR